MRIFLRASRPEDEPSLQRIERLAGERFREVGLNDVADDEPLSVDILSDATNGHGWVAVDEADRPLGYVIVDVVDGQAHIEQITVEPVNQGAGMARALIDHVRRWAADTGKSGVRSCWSWCARRSASTLTTFADVPWNGPLYRNLGFAVLSDNQIGPELRARRDAETAHGLDPQIRMCLLV